MTWFPTQMERALDALADAVGDKGPRPDYHDKVERRHRREWPRLWQAIDDVLAARAGRVA
jgi:hypothetical protein